MKALARTVSAAALVGVLALPVLYLNGRVELDALHAWLMVATVAWFASAPLWMNEQRG